MKRHAILFYGLVAYTSFVVAILYLVGFIGNIGVPKSIDYPASTTGEDGFTLDLLVNLGLLSLFAIQHSVMARRGFKNWLLKYLPKPMERSTYVLATSIVFGLLFYFWKPIGDSVWEVDSIIGEVLLTGIFLTGWAIALVSSFLISHFDLFGLRQAVLSWRKRPHTGPRFRKQGLYKYVRHPINLGFLIAVWSTPHMTLGHLVFSLTLTAYIFIATGFEERDLVASHGNVYRDYQREVPMILPFPRRP